MLGSSEIELNGNSHRTRLQFIHNFEFFNTIHPQKKIVVGLNQKNM
jgi:hypothetical protein